MKNDLNKVEQQWSKRRLFSSTKPKRRWPWLVLIIVVVTLGQILYSSLVQV